MGASAGRTRTPWNGASRSLRRSRPRSTPASMAARTLKRRPRTSGRGRGAGIAPRCHVGVTPGGVIHMWRSMLGSRWMPLCGIRGLFRSQWMPLRSTAGGEKCDLGGECGLRAAKSATWVGRGTSRGEGATWTGGTGVLRTQWMPLPGIRGVLGSQWMPLCGIRGSFRSRWMPPGPDPGGEKCDLDGGGAPHTPRAARAARAALVHVTRSAGAAAPFLRRPRCTFRSWSRTPARPGTAQHRRPRRGRRDGRAAGGR